MRLCLHHLFWRKLLETFRDKKAHCSAALVRIGTQGKVFAGGRSRAG